MPHPLLSAFEFLIDTVFTLYLSLILLRFLLQIARADFHNPICQTITKLTNAVILPVRRIVPGFAGIDWACLIVALVFSFVNQYLLMLIRIMSLPDMGGVLLYATADAVYLSINIYIFATLIWVITSWLTPHAINPVLQAVYPLIAPILRKLHRFVPRMAGLDISPVVLILGLTLINMALIIPLKQLAIQLIAGV